MPPEVTQPKNPWTVRLSRETRQGLIRTYRLARHLEPGLTWCRYFHRLMRNAGVQMRRQIRSMGGDPAAILAAADLDSIPLPREFDHAPDATKRSYMHAREKGKPKKGRRVKSQPLPPESSQS